MKYLFLCFIELIVGTLAFGLCLFEIYNFFWSDMEEIIRYIVILSVYLISCIFNDGFIKPLYSTAVEVLDVLKNYEVGVDDKNEKISM